MQLFTYSRKEHTDSTCYFYVNRRARIAYSEYRIAYSEYHIPYTVYFYVNAALRLRSHRNIRYTEYGIRYTVFGICYTLYGHSGSHRSSTCFQYALFVSKKKKRITHFEKNMASSEEDTSRGGGGGGNTLEKQMHIGSAAL